MSFNNSLRRLVQHDLVELEVALAASDRPEELLLALRGYSKRPAWATPKAWPSRAGRLRLAGGE